MAFGSAAVASAGVRRVGEAAWHALQSTTAQLTHAAAPSTSERREGAIGSFRLCLKWLSRGS